MQFQVLSVRTFFKDVPIRAVHSSFFHGKAKREGVFPSSSDYRLTNELDSPLQLHKNVYKIADLFAPEFELVVSEQLMEALAPVTFVKSIESVFEILYRYPFEPGDLGCGFDRYDRQMQFIDRQSDDASLHSTISRYFHLQIPKIHEIRVAYPNHAVTAVKIRSELKEIPMSERLLSEVPMYKFGGTTVIRSDIFDIIEPHIDWLYFTSVAGKCGNV